MNLSPIDATLNVIECLERKQELSEDLVIWLLSGLQRYRSGYDKTLDDALGLSVGPGRAHERLPAVWRKRERNRLIREIATRLKSEVNKTLAAQIIAYAMNTAVPNVDERETTILLCKLRVICINQKGDSTLALGWKRTLEIMNGDGCY
ncbi:hypothetical protein [Marinobacter xiaoshiensis]|uniref:Uncharacterized protein n=1 Tax=Marinobacter xiaoshiensis TaxID=3073652 RepID=A0ABU2HHG2_9GAMM|nr:hypothetical protein [Marinobacter sp. F60267]MDS1310504.1 hypothetical protein [Marinobacter sp. F60267]